MSTAATPLDSLLDPFSRCLDAESAQKVSEFRIDPALQAHVAYLANQANEGLLLGEERAEYEALVNAADLISILQLKAKRQLNK